MKTIIGFLVKIYKKIESINDQRRIKNWVAKGLIIGKNVSIMSGVSFDNHHPYLIRIGDNCAISKGVRILAHDATVHKYIGHTRIGKVEIKENCFIGEQAIILPGVTIGPNAMIAAGSVVTKSIPPNSCVAGVPARFYRKFDDLIEYHRKKIEECPCFERSQIMPPINKGLREKIRELVENGEVYTKGYEIPVYINQKK